MSNATVIRNIGTIFCTDNIGDATLEQVRSALERSNLDPEIARELSKRFCFVRAKNRLAGKGIVDEVSDTPDRLTFQLSKKFVEENKLTYEYEAQVWFDKSSETVGSDSEALVVKVNELFKHYGETYLPNDVSKLVKRIFDRQNGMISLRKAGVVYFVPEANNAILEKVALFIRLVGGSVITAPIGGENSEVREKALSSLTDAIKSDLERIVTELAELDKESVPLSARKAKNRYKELTAELERIKVFAKSLNADTKEMLNSVKSKEFDLALVAGADLDVIAALAHSGKLDNALGRIAKTAFDGVLPPVTDARVKKAEALIDLTPSLPIITKLVQPSQQALAQVG